uniref:RNase H type-1 domain-containing protein n=1 Tax=Cannabis sativa TaxID=3483 RepID=A0A803QA78_CANSA
MALSRCSVYLNPTAHVKLTETMVGLSSGSTETLRLCNFNLFVDMGINEDHGCMGLEAVMIDRDMVILCSSSNPVMAASFHPHVVEASTLLSGLMLCRRLGYNFITVFSDCIRLVQAINNKDKY